MPIKTECYKCPGKTMSSHNVYDLAIGQCYDDRRRGRLVTAAIATTHLARHQPYDIGIIPLGVPAGPRMDVLHEIEKGVVARTADIIRLVDTSWIWMALEAWSAEGFLVWASKRVVEDVEILALRGSGVWWEAEVEAHAVMCDAV